MVPTVNSSTFISLNSLNFDMFVKVDRIPSELLSISSTRDKLS